MQHVICCVSRSEILKAHGLETSHFATIDDAWDAADKFVAMQRAQYTGYSGYPDKLVSGIKAIDQFYYSTQRGTL